MNQLERIKEKAQKLGIDLKDNDLSSLANALGIKNFKEKDDLNKLENALDNEIQKSNFDFPSKVEYLDDNNLDIPEGQENYPLNKEKYNNNPGLNFNNLPGLENKNENNVANKSNVSESNQDNLLEEKQNNNIENPLTGKHKSSKNNDLDAIDETIASAGSMVLQKFGVPASLADIGARRGVKHSLFKKVKDNAIKHETEEDEEKINNLNNAVENVIKSDKAKKIKGTLKGKKETETLAEGIAFIKKYKWLILIAGGFLLGFLILVIIIALVADESESKNNSNNFNESSPYGEVCDGFAFNSSAMSKEEFVSKVRAYYALNTYKYATEFVRHAEDIYDISLKNNINPELVIVRAHAEGYSPSGKNVSLASYNNYWGIGCTNESNLSDCTKYSSFEDGLMGFIGIVSKSTSVSVMMKSYSSLGSYWYNPGGSGSGGCYYYPYLTEYLGEKRSNEVKAICGGNKCSKSDKTYCVETTDEDKAAYTKYQVKKMIDYRKNIFGIDEDDCSNFSNTCTIFAQGDKKWGSIHLGNSSSTMSNAGCVVTSIAIGISCSSVNLNVSDFDAGVLVNAMNKNNCFDNRGNLMNWNCPGISEIAPSVKNIADIDVSNKTSEEKTQIINSYNPTNHFVILKIVNKKTSSHFVVYTKTQGNYYIVKDPGNGKINNILMDDIKKVLVYEY